MSDGFITVGQCVEGLPIGRLLWEILFCGFLAWFMLGAVNESATLAFWYAPLSAAAALSKLAAATACGNLMAIFVGGWAADKYGRLAVIRPSLLLTASFGLMFQTAATLEQALIVRFMLGLLSGVLLAVTLPLLAELLPARNRGFYLTIWCCGWPLGALFCIIVNTLAIEPSWRMLNGSLLLPALIMYICVRSDMLPESPRFLYLAGRRDEGFNTLVDMYEKERLPLPWPAEHISVSSAPQDAAEGGEAGTSASGPLLPPSKRPVSSGPAPTAWLLLAVFATSLAARFMLVWLPLISARLGAREPGLVAARSSAAPAAPGWSEASLRDSVEAMVSLVFRPSPPALADARNIFGSLILGHAYVIEFLCLIVSSYASTWLRRRQLIRWAALCAAASVPLAYASVSGAGVPLGLAGPAVGAMMALQACCVNFLFVFATEHYATSQRVAACAAAAAAVQLAALLAPGLALRAEARLGQVAVVGCVCAGQLLAWFACLRLPLPGGRERPLHDVDEPRGPKESQSRLPKREYMTYQTL